MYWLVVVSISTIASHRIDTIVYIEIDRHFIPMELKTCFLYCFAMEKTQRHGKWVRVFEPPKFWEVRVNNSYFPSSGLSFYWFSYIFFCSCMLWQRSLVSTRKTEKNHIDDDDDDGGGDGGGDGLSDNLLRAAQLYAHCLMFAIVTPNWHQMRINVSVKNFHNFLVNGWMDERKDRIRIWYEINIFRVLCGWGKGYKCDHGIHMRNGCTIPMLCQIAVVAITRCKFRSICVTTNWLNLS